MSAATVFLNGEFLPTGEAKISPLDRGFIFGDGVYEVIPVYARRLFRLADHLRRLRASLDGIRLTNPYDDARWGELMDTLIARNAGDDQLLYLQVTRGVAKRDFGLPQGTAPTVFMMSNPLAYPSREQVESGVAAATSTDFRWTRCNIKSTSLLGANMLRQIAIDAGGVECVLFRDGILTEGSASNIFVVRGGKLLAPPKNHLILAGITYDVILELAEQGAIPYEVREISEQETKSADELLLTASSREVLAITTLDGKPVGDGAPGPVFKRLYSLYGDYKARLAREQPREVV
jgi:D-alanine transaminase